jgi:hypothetical protein
MTTDGLRAGRPTDGRTALALPRVLDLCDRLTGEIGRRAHMFGWLRGPDGERWLTVDAYYPSHRLVVVCRPDSDPDGALYAQPVAAHGLRLLSVSPAELGDGAAEALLARRIAELGPAPARPRPTPSPGPILSPSPGASEPPPRRVGQSRAAAAQRAARFVAGRHSEPGRRALRLDAATRARDGSPPSPAVLERERAGARVASARADKVLARVLGPPEDRAAERAAGPGERAALGATAGAALIAVVLVELYFGVGVFALGGGHVLLAFGLALDACARALGTVAAGRAGDQPSAWWCAIGGSPFVAGFALFSPTGPVTVEPAPLAGFVALFANGLVALWLLGAIVGI